MDTDLNEGDDSLSQAEVCTLFATEEFGLKMQYTFHPQLSEVAFVSSNVPFLSFLLNPARAQGNMEHLSRNKKESIASQGLILSQRCMRDFEGVQISSLDDNARVALTDFSFYLTIGNMDEAYKAVKSISSLNVWRNMAQMCVKTRRLDVAKVCLANMNNALAVHAVRDASNKAAAAGDETQVEAISLAMVATQLGMYKEAEVLLQEIARWDLLIDLLVSKGAWGSALKLSARHDRIHTKALHYQWARSLERDGNVTGAMEHYTEADCHRFEVPRLLHHLEKVSELQEYISKADDKELWKWWAALMETHGRFPDALHYYKQSGDTVAAVRVLCHSSKFEEAATLVNATQDAAAAFHLATQYEEAGNVSEALNFYSLAQAFKSAIRLALAQDMREELMRLAVQAPPEVALKVAEHFHHTVGDPSKAIFLYHRGKALEVAVELAFETESYDVLEGIMNDLDENTPPELLKKCAQFFAQHQQWDKAVTLYINGGVFNTALELCLKYGVKVDEDMAEKMTPEKKEGDDAHNTHRVEMLCRIAKVCREQGSFTLATKKYTQAGERVKAMRCLLKSGDTEKIVFFAGVSRQRDIYILAANYLQTLDWRSNPEYLKSIVSFYTKAKSLESLYTFYDAYAMLLIDELRDYEQALTAINQAKSYLSKARVPDKENKLAMVSTKIDLLERFITARSLVKSDPNQMIQMFMSLLEEEDCDTALRVGDVFAVMIEYYYSEGKYQQCYHLLTKMKERNIEWGPYVEKSMTSHIMRSLGMDTAMSADDDDDEIMEEIDEDM